MSEKLKAIIVDDEKLVRTMIRYCVDWEELGYDLVAECEGALYAFDAVEEYEPDVILTDICMPVIDGLELAEKVKAINPAIRVVILTGYDNFEYAQEGIKIGVSDYLLKPIDSEELQKVLVKTREEILKERRQEEEFTRIKEELEKQHDFMVERSLNELYHGAVSTESEEQLQFLGLDLSGDFYQTAVVGIFRSGKGPVHTAEDRLLYRLRAYEILKELTKEKRNFYVTQGDMQTSVILNCDPQINLTSECEKFLKVLTQTLQCEVYIGVGNACHMLSGLGNSWREANDALQLYYMKEESEVICYQDLCGSDELSETLDDGYVKKFSFYMKSGFSDQAKEMVGLIYDSIKDGHGEKTQIIIWSTRILLEIESILLELHISAENAVSQQNRIQNLFLFEHAGEAREYLDSVIDAAAVKIKKKIQVKEKTMITRICEYMEEHFTEEELSLTKISSVFYANANYLSRLFKEKLGKTFSGYLLELRMEKAMELLQKTEYKGYEVAELVGIKDPHYFSVCFKKYTGVSVSDYKKSITG